VARSAASAADRGNETDRYLRPVSPMNEQSHQPELLLLPRKAITRRSWSIPDKIVAGSDFEIEVIRRLVNVVDAGM
jgi:hypothetical protein